MLAEEVVHGLNIEASGIYVDATVGGGGHALLIAQKLGPGGHLYGFDQDPEAIQRAAPRLAHLRDRVTLMNSSFANMKVQLQARGVTQVNGILVDLGVSSDQLAAPARGFSFQQSGPLDMRMDPRQTTTAADIVNKTPESELASLLREYGEEPNAGRIACAIVRRRAAGPISRTEELASLVETVSPRRGARIHPATRVFQALRIRTNDELAALDQVLEDGVSALAPRGRMAVISFHSLEDRRVKQCFAAHVGRMESLQAGGRRWVGKQPAGHLVTRRPLVASKAECERNPRARSAKLRIFERHLSHTPEQD